MTSQAGQSRPDRASRTSRKGWSDEQFRALVTASSSVVYRMNADWTEMRQLGSSGFLTDTDEPTSAWMEKYIPPHERQRVLAAIEHAVRTRSVFDLEHQVVRKDGALGWTHSRAIPVIEAGEVLEWFGAADDVTARRQAEEQRRRALAEKEALLKEVHHRVKNSLQIVDSLLRLMADAFPDPRLRHVVADTANRVHAIAEIHQLLSEGESLAEINLATFVERLCAHLSTIEAPPGLTRPIYVNVTLRTLDLRRAVPLGLILNELISNACKHAFAPGEAGTIVVDVHQHEGTINVRVRDNGRGLPGSLPTGTLGMQLVKILAEQLRGDVRFSTDSGTLVTVSLPSELPPNAD
jgi:two-component sensor histidine kinase